MKTNMKVLLGVLALVVIGAAVYFSKSELQKGATRRPVGPQPDYEISSIIVDPANPVEGENFKISVTVKNKSSTTAATVPSKTLLHLNGQPLPIATTQPLGPLATEEEVWQTTSTQHRLLIRSCADADRAIAESNERNNCRERTLDLLPPPLPPPPPPLPLCTEGQYNCESWTACSAEGSQTGTSCMVNSPGTCVIPLGPLTRACTPPPPPMPDLVIEDISIINQDPDGMINFRVRVRNAGNAPVTVVEDSPSTNPAIREETIDAAHNVVLERAGTVGTTECLSVSSEGRPIDCRRSFTIEPGEIITSNSFARGNNPNTGQLSGGGVGIRLTVDYAGNVTESDETNNSFDFMVPASYLTFRPPPPPDCMPDQYTCASWSECSASGSQTGSSCTANSGVSCTLPVTATQSCTYIPPMPDLVIDSVTLTQDSSSGVITGRTIIRNAGTAAVDFLWRNPLRSSSYFINNAGNRISPISNDAIYNGTLTLQAGTIMNIVHYFTPGEWSQAGVHGIRFTVDSRNVAPESNETNNTYDIAIPPEFLAWIAPPNLFIHWNGVTINPASPTAGSPVNFSAVISNTGSTTAPASTARLIISGTSTSGVYYEAYRQNISIPELSAVNSATANFEWPSAIEGSYTSQICADSENVISENNEGDNCGRAYRSGSGYPFIVAPAPSE